MLDTIAKILSMVFYPLFIPTYGMTLFCYAYSLHTAPLPRIWAAVAIIGTLTLTCLIPISAIWLMVKQGKVTDIQIANARERNTPYLYTLIGFGCWWYLLFSILHAPLVLSMISAGATLAIGLVMLINRWWKISAHLTGIGGLVGGVMAYSLSVGAIPTGGTMILFFGLSLLIMWARLRLDAHTDTQVSVGWLLGISCTFMPYCIIHFYAA